MKLFCFDDEVEGVPTPEKLALLDKHSAAIAPLGAGGTVQLPPPREIPATVRDLVRRKRPLRTP